MWQKKKLSSSKELPGCQLEPPSHAHQEFTHFCLNSQYPILRLQMARNPSNRFLCKHSPCSTVTSMHLGLSRAGSGRRVPAGRGKFWSGVLTGSGKLLRVLHILTLLTSSHCSAGKWRHISQPPCTAISENPCSQVWNESHSPATFRWIENYLCCIAAKWPGSQRASFRVKEICLSEQGLLNTMFLE